LVWDVGGEYTSLVLPLAFEGGFPNAWIFIDCYKGWLPPSRKGLFTEL